VTCSENKRKKETEKKTFFKCNVKKPTWTRIVYKQKSTSIARHNFQKFKTKIYKVENCTAKNYSILTKR